MSGVGFGRLLARMTRARNSDRQSVPVSPVKRCGGVALGASRFELGIIRKRKEVKAVPGSTMNGIQPIFRLIMVAELHPILGPGIR